MFFRKKPPGPTEVPEIKESNGINMLIIHKNSVRNLGDIVNEFLTEEIPNPEDFPVVPYLVMYFDGTPLHSSTENIDNLGTAITNNVLKFLAEVQGDDVMTSTFAGPVGFVTLVGIKMDIAKANSIVGYTGTC